MLIYAASLPVFIKSSTSYLIRGSKRRSLTIRLSNIPQMLSGEECASVSPKDCKKARIQQSCTIKCVTTCVRGGEAPGKGPLNVRRFFLLVTLLPLSA